MRHGYGYIYIYMQTHVHTKLYMLCIYYLSIIPIYNIYIYDILYISTHIRIFYVFLIRI